MCPSISDNIPEVWKLIRKQSVALEEIEHRVFGWKLELFRKYGIRVQNHRVGHVDNEDKNQSRYLNMSNTYMAGVLYTKIGNRELGQGYWKCERETQECDVT